MAAIFDQTFSMTKLKNIVVQDCIPSVFRVRLLNATNISENTNVYPRTLRSLTSAHYIFKTINKDNLKCTPYKIPYSKNHSRMDGPRIQGCLRMSAKKKRIS